MENYRYISDVHSYMHVFDYYMQEAASKDEILILAGDLREFGNRNGGDLLDKLRTICSIFKKVIFVPGNHEYYGSYINTVDDKIREGLSDVDNFILLQNGGFIEIDGVRIIGATLWSDITNCREIVKYMLSDYSVIFIKDGDTKSKLITPDYTLDLHRRHLENIKESLYEWEGPSIVVTHHTPSFKSMTPGFEDSMINSAFMNELELEKWPTYWIHGHVHSRHNYMHNGCNVLCNPVGYKGEETKYLLTTNEFKL
jgi:Icc-related predicted phosphoesterase